ncbi:MULTISPECIES: nitroreductase [Tatumella]|uniref:Nitroreductase n=1 Tax=Tatumella punctata TaxID=399969 RepID=A0ABW1VLI5_9GAMM|nr:MULTISPECIES: nitroreductase [unclassified Tatumella]MBS0855150.1 nitroreductase [Tatumella sp. JGM16]MBS0876181.1 nitroreductase [Tatumella sp. JGM82]MBS0889229.1 nitroreductase [Tatumella sp. JGM94]MBS0901111.1 nitroreductase [Tatumella sp. JGM100]MBS0912045.1 nitroreductase [Tatumella sp. JGM91]
MQTSEHPLPDFLADRHSCRAFLTDAVPLTDIQTMLTAARSAPSGANLQPGAFHVFTGQPLQTLTRRLSKIAETTPPEEELYSYFPRPMSAVLKQRQRAAGYALYRALGIEKRDIAGRKGQFAANYRFFDAPVGMVVTIQRDMGAGCYMDLGMALMNLFLTAGHLGYGCCGIGALANYGRGLHQLLDLPDDQLVVCGIALGRPDPLAAVNQFRTDRAALDEFSVLHGFNQGEQGQ